MIADLLRHPWQSMQSLLAAAALLLPSREAGVRLGPVRGCVLGSNLRTPGFRGLGGSLQCLVPWCLLVVLGGELHAQAAMNAQLYAQAAAQMSRALAPVAQPNTVILARLAGLADRHEPQAQRRHGTGSQGFVWFPPLWLAAGAPCALIP